MKISIILLVFHSIIFMTDQL